VTVFLRFLADRFLTGSAGVKSHPKRELRFSTQEELDAIPMWKKFVTSASITLSGSSRVCFDGLFFQEQARFVAGVGEDPRAAARQAARAARHQRGNLTAKG